MTKFEKETRLRFYVFLKKQQLPRRIARQQRAHMTRTVLVHKQAVLTVLLHWPITSMTPTLSDWCSNRAGDNQSLSRILLKFRLSLWFDLCAG